MRRWGTEVGERHTAPRSVPGGAVLLEHQRGNPATCRELNPVRSSPGAYGLRVRARGGRRTSRPGRAADPAGVLHVQDERGAQLGCVVVVEVDLVGHTVQPEANRLGGCATVNVICQLNDHLPSHGGLPDRYTKRQTEPTAPSISHQRDATSRTVDGIPRIRLRAARSSAPVRRIARPQRPASSPAQYPEVVSH